MRGRVDVCLFVVFHSPTDISFGFFCSMGSRGEERPAANVCVLVEEEEAAVPCQTNSSP